LEETLFIKKYKKMELTNAMQNEIINSAEEFGYFAENYVKIRTPKSNEKAPFILNNRQKDALAGFVDNEFINHIYGERQQGYSTLITAFVAWKILFSFDKTYVVATPRLNQSVDLIKLINDIVSTMPEYMRPTLEVDTKNKKCYSNGCILIAVPVANEGVIGWSPDMVIIDNATYCRNLDNFMTAIEGSIEPDGKIVLVSTFEES
jgi:hypothetical protein